VSVYRPPYTIEGSPEWAERAIRWSRNTLKSIQGDAKPFAQNLRGFRIWCEAQGKTWAAFCREDLDADPAWVEKIEEGVAVLEGRGHEGPISNGAAVDAAEQVRATMDLSDPPKAPGAPKGSRNNPSGKAKEAPNGSASTVSPKPRKQKRDAKYLAGRIKAKAATDATAAEVVERVRRGEYKSMRAAARDAGVVKASDPVRDASRAVAKVPTQRLAELVAALPETTARLLMTCLRDRLGGGA
jgi:hypothetical protein